jgi:hypothetical protein
MEKPVPGAWKVSAIIGPGIYFLYLKGELQWIGSSKNVIHRVYQHYAGNSTTCDGGWTHLAVDFDDVYVLPCIEEGLDIMERSLIRRLQPKRNIKHQGPVKETTTVMIGGKERTLETKAKWRGISYDIVDPEFDQ